MTDAYERAKADDEAWEREHDNLTTEPTTHMRESDGMTYRETRVEYTESFGEAYKSLSIETFTTLDELRGLCAGLMGVRDE